MILPAPIRIWPFDKAPQKWRELSQNGGDEDWIAEVDTGLIDVPFFLEEGGRFGCCSVEKHEIEKGLTVLIGCHA